MSSWQQKIFKFDAHDQEIKIKFFDHQSNFKSKLLKHVYDRREQAGWLQVCSEILNNYPIWHQISNEEIVLIYEELALIIEEALQFIWKLPLRMEYFRKENADWKFRSLGVAPKGYILICNEDCVITCYFVPSSQEDSHYDLFYNAVTYCLTIPRDDLEKDRYLVTNETWDNILGQYHNLFLSSGPFTKKLDTIIAEFHQNGETQ